MVRPIQGMLFGGTLTLAGLAHADNTFNPVVGSGGYAYRLTADVILDDDSVLGSGSAAGPASVYAYESCGTYISPYIVLPLFSWSSGSVEPTRLTAESYWQLCHLPSADARMFFQIVTHTEILFGWSGQAGDTAGVWRIGGAGEVLVAGPGAMSVADARTEVFVLTPGLYRVQLTLAPAERRDAMSLRVRGDAPCPCDLSGDGGLNVDDVDSFVSAFLTADLAADFDGSGTLNVDDVDAFVACFLGGCP